MRATREATLRTLERLLVGVLEKSTATCEWYEGILEDAMDEARTILRAAESDGGR